MSPLDVAVSGLVLAFLVALYRVAVGPSLADRAVAAEVCFVTIVGLTALLAAASGSTHFLDAVVVAALLQFITTVSLARLLARKERE